MMRWEKPAEGASSRTMAKDWAWAYPTYDLTINKPKAEISKIEIDESGLMADINRENNVYNQLAE
jgi:hypothetical protein